MNPQIPALYRLQKRDRKLTVIERKLEAIPKRIAELEEDLGKLERMLNIERRKCEDTRAFQRTQEAQLEEEEELLRNARARLGQIKNTRELTAVQREIDTTRKMATARSDEIAKIREGASEAESRIEAMTASLEELRVSASAEIERLRASESKYQARIEKLRTNRNGLTGQLDPQLLQSYDRIRRRVGGIAFVGASNGLCLACKMHVPHQVYVQLRKGDEIPACESCGRFLYWVGHFDEEDEEPQKPKPAKKKATKKKATKSVNVP